MIVVEGVKINFDEVQLRGDDELGHLLIGLGVCLALAFFWRSLRGAWCACESTVRWGVGFMSSSADFSSSGRVGR